MDPRSLTMDFQPLIVRRPYQYRPIRQDDPFSLIEVCCACIILFCDVVWCMNPQGPARPPPKLVPSSQATPQQWAVYHSRFGACLFPVSSMVGWAMVIPGRKLFFDSKLNQDLMALDIACIVLFVVSLGLLCLYCFKAEKFIKAISTSCLTAILMIWILRLAYISYCLQVYLSQEYNDAAGFALFSFGLVCECCGGLFFICYNVNYCYYLYTHPNAREALPKPGPAIEHVKPFINS